MAYTRAINVLRESRDKNSLNTSLVRTTRFVIVDRPLLLLRVACVGANLVGPRTRKLVEAPVDPPRNGRVAKSLMAECWQLFPATSRADHRTNCSNSVSRIPIISISSSLKPWSVSPIQWAVVVWHFGGAVSSIHSLNYGTLPYVYRYTKFCGANPVGLRITGRTYRDKKLRE